MGNRVKGREKKKSIKAASHSKMGSKRKLSRLGKKLKRNNAGLEATFIGRSKCLKLLQVTIKDFRRLCILKGIYPREPRGKVRLPLYLFFKNILVVLNLNCLRVVSRKQKRTNVLSCQRYSSDCTRANFGEIPRVSCIHEEGELLVKCLWSNQVLMIIGRAG